MTNEEAIKILDQMPIPASLNFTFEEMAEALQMATKSLKNERPHGEWKDITPNHYFTCGGEPLVICPFCEDQESRHVQGFENHMWNFCPNCGADMRGDKE